MQSNRTWIEISRKNLLYNLNSFKKLVKKNTKIACVVKANAYGHGIEKVVSILKGKSDWFAVDNIDEALKIRKLKIKKPILVMGYVLQERLKEAIDNDISLTIYNKTTLNKLALIKNSPIKIHLKIETGLNRQGAGEKEILLMLKTIKNNKHLILEGISTHFADIEDTLDSTYAMEQLKRFKSIKQKINKFGLKPVCHCAASAASLLYPKTHFNLIRVGISLYGLWPSKETRIALQLSGKKISLKPVLTWKSTIAQVKKIKMGESVGYGRTWFAPKNSKIAIIPVGYFDGYDRKLSNNSKVLINGEQAPVIGRIAMNMMVADVTEISNVKEMDKVVLLGKMGKKQITTDELAQKTSTIDYEVVSRIGQHIRRVII